MTKPGAILWCFLLLTLFLFWSDSRLAEGCWGCLPLRPALNQHRADFWGQGGHDDLNPESGDDSHVDWLWFLIHCKYKKQAVCSAVFLILQDPSYWLVRKFVQTMGLIKRLLSARHSFYHQECGRREDLASALLILKEHWTLSQGNFWGCIRMGQVVCRALLTSCNFL